MICRVAPMCFQTGNLGRRPTLSLREVKRRSNLIGGTVHRNAGLPLQWIPEYAGMTAGGSAISAEIASGGALAMTF